MKHHVFLANRITLTFVGTRDTFEHAQVFAHSTYHRSGDLRTAVVIYEDDGDGSWWKYCGGVAEISGKVQWIAANGKHFMQKESLPDGVVIERPVIVSGYDPRNPPRGTY
jgi:hypothetical protein